MLTHGVRFVINQPLMWVLSTRRVLYFGRSGRIFSWQVIVTLKIVVGEMLLQKFDRKWCLGNEKNRSLILLQIAYFLVHTCVLLRWIFYCNSHKFCIRSFLASLAPLLLLQKKPHFIFITPQHENLFLLLSWVWFC